MMVSNQLWSGQLITEILNICIHVFSFYQNIEILLIDIRRLTLSVGYGHCTAVSILSLIFTNIIPQTKQTKVLGKLTLFFKFIVVVNGDDSYVLQ